MITTPEALYKALNKPRLKGNKVFESCSRAQEQVIGGDHRNVGQFLGRKNLVRIIRQCFGRKNLVRIIPQCFGRKNLVRIIPQCFGRKNLDRIIRQCCCEWTLLVQEIFKFHGHFRSNYQQSSLRASLKMFVSIILYGAIQKGQVLCFTVLSYK